MTEAEHMVRIIEPGTPMQKVIPPRLVEPYLTNRHQAWMWSGGFGPFVAASLSLSSASSAAWSDSTNA